jgi:hypothetical protein
MLPLALAILFAAGGCATFHDLYFERTTPEDSYFDGYRLGLRIFAFQEKRVAAVAPDSSDFVVSVRIVSPDSDRDRGEWSEQAATVDSLAEAFLRSVRAAFAVDSLVFYQTPPGAEPIVLNHDRENFTPRRDDYLTLRFGRTEIPLETQQIRAVMYVTHSGGDAVDSVVWPMQRVDKFERGISVFRSGIQGYE